MIFHVVLECGHKFLSFVTSHAFADRQTDRKALQYRALHYTCSRAVKINTTSSLRLEWSDMNEIRGLEYKKIAKPLQTAVELMELIVFSVLCCVTERWSLHTVAERRSVLHSSGI